MKESKWFPGIAFLLLMVILGFLSGALIGSFTVSPGDGLAGGAKVFMGGVLGTLAALVLGGFLIAKLTRRQLLRGLVVVAVAVPMVLGVIFLLKAQREKHRATPTEQPADAPVTRPKTVPIALVAPTRHVMENLVGIGMVKPRLVDGGRLRFYHRADFDEIPNRSTPHDSLVFGQGTHSVDSTSAPPWFWPEVMKLDYDLLLLRAVTLSRNWIEVIVNKETGETRWIDRYEVEFEDWSTFLVGVHSVEVIDQQANLVRIKPMAAASAISEAWIPLRPLAVQGSWMQVSTDGLADHIPPTGWIQWRDDARLLITFSMLS